MSFLNKIFSGGIKDIVSSIGSVVDDLSLSKEEKQQFNIKIQELANGKEKLLIDAAQAELDSYLENTKDARNREILIATSDKAPLLNKIITPILALVVTIGGGYLFYQSNTPDERTALIGVIMLVLGYYFGSSIGAKASGDTMRKMLGDGK